MKNSPRRYNKSYSLHGATPKALQWHDYKSAALRYQNLLTGLDFCGKSILDVGCGMGDLLPYLLSKSSNFTYLGVDVNANFIETAQKRYDGFDFKVLNPFKDELNKKFDIVLLCGALNENKENWLQSRKEKIKKLYDLANEAFVFNMAGSLIPPAPGRIVAYADAREILDFCATLTPKIILQTNYHPKDFTVKMFK